MFLYNCSDYSVDPAIRYRQYRMSRGAEKHVLRRGTSMKPNTALFTTTLRAALAAAVAILSPSAASLGQDSHASIFFILPASTENVQWGWYDINEKPKLTVKSGDTVSIETLSHSLGQIKPGVPMDEIVRLRKANPGG